MAGLPEHTKASIAQRQRQRTRCAQTIALLLDDQRLASMADQLIAQGITLLSEDKADLNGTPGVRAAITVEEEAWHALQRTGVPHASTHELQRVHDHIETIKRAIELQATLIDLAIPNNQETPSLQVLWDEYQQRYPNEPEQ